MCSCTNANNANESGLEIGTGLGDIVGIWTEMGGLGAVLVSGKIPRLEFNYSGAPSRDERVADLSVNDVDDDDD